MGLLTRNREEAPCTVEIEHRFESLHAHVRFDNGAVVEPGDEVLVHGAPVIGCPTASAGRRGPHRDRHPRQPGRAALDPARPAISSSWNSANSRFSEEVKL